MGCRLLSVKNVMFIVGLLLFGAIGSVSYAEWELQDSGVTERLRDISFVDELHGWAVGDNSTIIHTADGGETWVKQESPVDGLELRKVQFVNYDIGFTCGMPNKNAIGTFLKTKNGGRTWENIDFGEDARHIWSFHFLDDLTGWVTVEFINETAPGSDETHILFTSDGGLSWETQFVYGHQIRDLYFIDQNKAWAIGSNYMDTFDDTHIIRTTNGGENWWQVATLQNIRQKVYATDEVVWTLRRSISFSFDDGFSWDVSFREERSYDIAPLEGKDALLLTHSNGYDSAILFTNDGGLTTSLVTEIASEDIIAWHMFALSKNIFWLIGSTGKIARYRNEAASVEDLQPKTLQLNQNTPNPFNASTTITFSLYQDGNTKLIVYNAVGAVIDVLLSSYLPVGDYSTVWNASNYSSGVCVCKLIQNDRIVSKKMLYLK